MAEVKLEDSFWDDDAGFDDDPSRFPSFTPATSLHDRFAALTSLSSGPSASSNFDLSSTHPTGPTIRHCEQKDGPPLGYSENRAGVLTMGPRGFQDQQKTAFENEYPSSAQSSGSYKFNPLASTFDASPKKQLNFLKHSSVSTPTSGQIDPLAPSFGYTPIKAQLNPFARPFDFPSPTIKTDTTLAVAQTQETLAYLHQYESSMGGNNTGQKMRIMGHFYQGSETPIARSTEKEVDERTEFQVAEGSATESSIEIEECDSLQDTKSEDSDGSFKFAPEVEESEEASGIIPKVEPLVEDNGTNIETVSSSEGRNVNQTTGFDKPGFSVIPDTVKSRYPQMARFLATLIIQETTAAHNNSAIALPIWGQRPENRTESQNLPMQQTVSLDVESIKTSLGRKLPMAASSSRAGELLEESSSQKNVALSSKSSCTPPLSEHTREDNRGYDILRVDTSIGEAKTEQDSKHQKPVEEFATPAGAQSVGDITSEILSRDVMRTMPQQDDQESFVAKSTVSKDELFRDSQESFTIRASSSRRSSVSSEGSITFSLMEDDSLSGKESEKADRESPEDEERSRRSPGPSPSPERAAGAKSSPARSGRFEPLGFSPTGDKKEEGLKVVAEGRLNRLHSSSKNDNVVLPTGRPSVLARIHSCGSNYDDESDSDGVAPGEWVKPIELIEKKAPKPNWSNEGTMKDSLVGRRPEKSSGPQPRSITPQTGIQLDKLSEKEKEIVAWREKGIIETTIESMKTATLLAEGNQREKGSVPLCQGDLFAPQHGSVSESSLVNKNYKVLTSTLNILHRGGSSRGSSRGGSSRGSSSRGGSIIRTQKDDISARWQRFTDQPASNSRESLALLNPGTQSVSTTPKINPENISETKESPFVAKSGTFTDKRFATEKAFYEEALVKDGLNKKTEDALESLIKNSRENALKKSREAQMSGKAGRSRPAGYQVNNVVVKINEKGQQIWNVEPPTEKQFEEEGPTVERVEGGENQPLKQGRRRF